MRAPAQLAALAAIHRRGSFDLAATDLRVTPSAVLQRIRALEEAAGTLLIRRGQPGLAFSEKDLLRHRSITGLTGVDVRRISFPGHRIGSPQGFVAACLSGLGWTLNPEPLMASYLAAGRLCDLAADRPLDVQLYWQFTRAMASALQNLTRSLRVAAAGVLHAPG